MTLSIITTVLGTLGDILLQETQLLYEFEEELRKMESELLYIQSFLSEASLKKRKNMILKTTMDELRDLLYDADDLLVDISINSKPVENVIQKFINYLLSPLELLHNHKMAKRLETINERITGIKGRILSYLGPLTEQSGRLDSPTPRWVPLDIKKSDIVGMDEEIKNMKSWIFQENQPIDVFAIVGMGGLGKTTLAHRLFSDEDVKNIFPYRMSVSVGRKFKEEVLIKRMLSDLDVEDETIRGEVDDLLHLLHQCLTGTYLIVLDDVWETGSLWWQRLRSGLPPINGSKIIITTRNEHVARTMGAGDDSICYPKLLSKEESWSLFHEIAFATCPYTNHGLEVVGRKIAERCGGLPLAIKAVAGMMMGKPPYVKDWELVLKNLMLELAESKEGEAVMKCLQLSYEDLPPQLRSCLLCFSIFPEEYDIPKRKLIYWWIGEGFAKENMGKTAEQIAEDYFMEMVSRCLIQKEGIKAHNQKVISCRIHDLVRDLVIRIAKEEEFILFDDKSTDRHSRRASIGSTNLDTVDAKRKLRSLVAPRDPQLSIDSHLSRSTLCEFRLLRVLDLGKFCVDSWDSIGHMQHLVYLSLNGNEQIVELPNSIGKLINLQILDLHGCKQLKKLPSQITGLKNLTHLNVHDCDNLKNLPKGMGKLIKLQVFRGFKFDTSSNPKFCRITELKSMNHLHRLTIYIDCTRETKVDDLGELSQLQFLQSLELVAPYDRDGDDGEMKRMIEELRPPHQVEKLKLRGNYGEWLPSWLQPFALPSLRTLSILSQGGQMMNKSFLSCETGFWRLKVLLLFNVIIEEEWWRVRRAMPHLKYLQVRPLVNRFPCDHRGVWKKPSKHGKIEEITEETISSPS